MRRKFERTPDLMTVPVSAAKIPTNCRDEAPKLLAGLKYIYETEDLNEKVFSLLSSRINSGTNKDESRGRKGMGLWEILVLAVMRQGLNANYDRLHYLANNDKLMRTVMGVAKWTMEDEKEYGLTTIKDNLNQLDEQTINEINNLVVSHGHQLLKKKKKQSLS